MVTVVVELGRGMLRWFDMSIVYHRSVDAVLGKVENRYGYYTW